MTTRVGRNLDKRYVGRARQDNNKNIGEYLFFFRVFYTIVYTGCTTGTVLDDDIVIHIIHGRDNVGWVTMKRKSPNDARCVVWALAVFILFTLLFFLDANVCFIVNSDCNLHITTYMESGG